MRFRVSAHSITLFLQACITALLAVMACLWTGAVWAAGDAGAVKNVKGQVSILRNGERVEAVVGSPLKPADTLMTAANSAVGVVLNDGTLLSTGANSTLTLNKFVFHETAHTGELDATIKKGTLAVISGKLAKTSREAVVYRTPNAILGVRGTAFLIEVGEDEKASQP